MCKSRKLAWLRKVDVSNLKLCSNVSCKVVSWIDLYHSQFQISQLGIKLDNYYNYATPNITYAYFKRTDVKLHSLQNCKNSPLSIQNSRCIFEKLFAKLSWGLRPAERLRFVKTKINLKLWCALKYLKYFPKQILMHFDIVLYQAKNVHNHYQEEIKGKH